MGKERRVKKEETETFGGTRKRKKKNRGEGRSKG